MEEAWDWLLRHIERNNVDAVRNLLRWYPTLAQQKDKDGWTPLHTACTFYPLTQLQERLQIVRLLCEAGVPLDARTCRGARTGRMEGRPLDILCTACYHLELVVPVALVLVEYGADASIAKGCGPSYGNIYRAWQTRQAAVKLRRLAVAAFVRGLQAAGVPRDVCKMCVVGALSGRLNWRNWEGLQ